MPSQAIQPARRGRGHHWTKFELDIALGLICKGEHLRSTDLVFATKLNEALNGNKTRAAYENDISLDDVRDLLAHIETEKKAALAFIERQPYPHVMTRTKKRVFERNIPFTGSKEEWATGRKDKVMAPRMTDATSGGVQSTFKNVQGMQIERWVSGVEKEPILQPGHMKTSEPVVPFTSRANETPVLHVWNTPRNIGMTPAYGQLHSQAPTLPPPLTPVIGGWATPSSNTTTFNMGVAPNPDMSWRVDAAQEKINATTSSAGQIPLSQQIPPLRNDVGWTKQATTPGTPCLRETQPPKLRSEGLSEAVAADKTRLTQSSRESLPPWRYRTS